MSEQGSFRALVTRVAFRRRGSAAAAFLVRQAFGHASRALPVRRVGESAHVLAFHHPVPGFEPVHILLVPKFSAPSVMHLTDAQRQQVSNEVEALAPEALDRLGRSGARFLVVVNGGSRQDVGQVHFHLLTKGYAVARPSASAADRWVDVPDPVNDVHEVRFGDHPLRAGLTRAAENRDPLQLDRRGYSIVWDARARDAGDVAHLTAGPIR